MSDVVADLVQALQELRNDKQLATRMDEAELDQAGQADLEQHAALFREMFGFVCPETLKPGLILPDMFSVEWKLNDKVAGEFALSNHFLTMNRTLDESLQAWVPRGIKLVNARIVDAVVLHGGPIYTLVLVLPSQLSEQLYMFNTRENYELEVNYEEYLQQLSLTKGITYWQYLFCREMRLSGFEKAVLREEIAYLRAAFPNRDYQTLQLKWNEKGN